MLLPAQQKKAARAIALLTALAGLALALTGALQYKLGSGIITVQKLPWIPSLGIDYYLAADGISLTLVLLTGIAAVVGIPFSWKVDKRAEEIFAFFLAVIFCVFEGFLSFYLL